MPQLMGGSRPAWNPFSYLPTEEESVETYRPGFQSLLMAPSERNILMQQGETAPVAPLTALGNLVAQGMTPTRGLGAVGRTAKEPMVRLFRGEATGQGANIPEWVRQSPEYAQGQGRWFTDVPEIADWYLREAGPTGRVSTVKVPKSQLEKYQVQNIPEARRFSGDPEREFFLPSEVAETRKPTEGFQRLLKKRGMQPAEVPGRAVGPVQELPESSSELAGLMEKLGGKYGRERLEIGISGGAPGRDWNAFFKDLPESVTRRYQELTGGADWHTLPPAQKEIRRKMADKLVENYRALKRQQGEGK